MRRRERSRRSLRILPGACSRPAAQRGAADDRCGRARRSGWTDFDWEDARIEVLEALGRSDEAQSARCSCFERALGAEHLRAYLKRLPDFDDVEAEERALNHAERYESLLQALAFLVSWPAVDEPRASW